MIEYRIEKLADIFDELTPMLFEHYKEVAMYQDKIELDPNYDRYFAMEETDSMRIYTAREDGELVGYNIFFLLHHPHYQSTFYAANDIVYVAPEKRHEFTIPFFQHCEADLKESGVQVITYHMKVMKTFHSLMGFLEFDHAEHIYSKYIG